jgi:hypothetical protein
MGSAEHAAALASLSSRFSGLGCSRPLLTGQISLGKSLLAGLGFPVVVPNSPAVDDHAASELPEHTASSHNGYLSRPVRERQYFLGHKIIFLDLIGNDLV